MTAILSSGSLLATHDYYRSSQSSASSNSSCGNAEYPGEDSPHWWASFSSGSPLSHSWPQCWRPQGPRNPPHAPSSIVTSGFGNHKEAATQPAQPGHHQALVLT
ncbi:pancreatic progenitor cell differentiation and proliferation factor-like [Fukomys damarensis]|uniref:pancreatic progenitor cell differentiation and proliferation factor-like n=1 Tax=Fukomys damarensis TaxID=885580 RepID=UPI0014557E9F|nr:pancreatic progenitor cell differentiation and proliferation factor-like [Fukomys damarensis]